MIDGDGCTPRHRGKPPKSNSTGTSAERRHGNASGPLGIPRRARPHPRPPALRPRHHPVPRALRIRTVHRANTSSASTREPASPEKPSDPSSVRGWPADFESCSNRTRATGECDSTCAFGSSGGRSCSAPVVCGRACCPWRSARIRGGGSSRLLRGSLAVEFAESCVAAHLGTIESRVADLTFVQIAHCCIEGLLGRRRERIRNGATRHEAPPRVPRVRFTISCSWRKMGWDELDALETSTG